MRATGKWDKPRTQTLSHLLLPSQWSAVSRGQAIPKGINLVALRWWCNSPQEDPGNCTASKIKGVFMTKMESPAVLLFSNWTTYRKSLPRRESSRIINLWEQPFYARKRDLSDMAEKLVDPSAQRGPVSYVAAPTQTGKTASILPAFCYAVEIGLPFSHYIYMPFFNNVNRFHHAIPEHLLPTSLPDDVLEQVGMRYMVICFETACKCSYFTENQAMHPASPAGPTRLRKHDL